MGRICGAMVAEQSVGQPTCRNSKPKARCDALDTPSKEDGVPWSKYVFKGKKKLAKRYHDTGNQVEFTLTLRIRPCNPQTRWPESLSNIPHLISTYTTSHATSKRR